MIIDPVAKQPTVPCGNVEPHDEHDWSAVDGTTVQVGWCPGTGLGAGPVLHPGVQDRCPVPNAHPPHPYQAIIGEGKLADPILCPGVATGVGPGMTSGQIRAQHMCHDVRMDLTERIRLAADNGLCTLPYKPAGNYPMDTRWVCAEPAIKIDEGVWRCRLHAGTPGSDLPPEPEPVTGPTCTQQIGEEYDEDCGDTAVVQVGGEWRCRRHLPEVRNLNGDRLDLVLDGEGLRKALVATKDQVRALVKGINRAEARTAELERQLGTEDREAVINEVCQWWAEVAAKDVLRFAPKAAEYGAADLVLMGDGLRLLSGTAKWDDQGDPAEREKVGQEMAVIFYLYGKIARALSAYAEGRWPSDDTLEDIRIYSMMLTRIRQFGRLL